MMRGKAVAPLIGPLSGARPLIGQIRVWHISLPSPGHILLTRGDQGMSRVSHPISSLAHLYNHLGYLYLRSGSGYEQLLEEMFFPCSQLR